VTTYNQSFVADVPSDMPSRPWAPALRSLLITPGSEDMTLVESLDVALASGADAIAMDLEDPRRPSPYTDADRVATREWVKGRLAEMAATPQRPQIWARVQGIDTRNTLQDLLAVVQPALSGIILPKSTSTRDIIAADALLTQVEVINGVPVGQTRIMPLLETPQGVRLAYDLAMASPRVSYMGGHAGIAGDQARLVGFTWTREGLETLVTRTKTVVDARAAGIRFPIGGMWAGDPDDMEGLRAFSLETRGFGYFGMLLARPRHVQVVNDAFTPTAQQVADWEEIEKIYLAAKESNSGYMSRVNAVGQEEQVHFHAVEMAASNLEWVRGLRETGAIDD
jgi:citrate lyase subunit beta/citryl-CoA lyase